jgi:hypothetical protein
LLIFYKAIHKTQKWKNERARYSFFLSGKHRLLSQYDEFLIIDIMTIFYFLPVSMRKIGILKMAK